MKVEKNIKIDEETWYKLVELKYKWKMIRIADVIKRLLNAKNI